MAASKTKPTPPREQANPFGGCLYFTANAVAREISRLAEEAFAPSGLCPSGALLLKLVVDRPGIAPSSAAEVLHLAPSSVTRFADALERKGLVEREHVGRQVLLSPTTAGKRKLRAVQSCWETLHAQYTRLVGAKRADKLASELCTAAERLGEERS